MNIEKILFVTILLMGGAVYIQYREPYEPAEYKNCTTEREAEIKPDFRIRDVIDNTPFRQYYVSAARNPFVPVQDESHGNIADSRSDVDTVSSRFTFPWHDRRDDPGKKDVQVAQLPDKNPPDEDIVKVDPAEQRKDNTIPVYLIGFAKTSEKNEMPRKAILAHKKTGQIYSLQVGEECLGMTVADITPYSVVIRMADGRRIEFLNDILKETP